MALPPSCIFLSCNHVQFVSSWVDLTKVRCTPKPRCTAEQSMHRKTPYVTLAHAGFFALQSKHVWKRNQFFISNSKVVIKYGESVLWRCCVDHWKYFAAHLLQTKCSIKCDVLDLTFSWSPLSYVWHDWKKTSKGKLQIELTVWHFGLRSR